MARKPEHIDFKLKAIVSQFLSSADAKTILSVDDVSEYVSSLRDYARTNTKTLRRSIIKGKIHSSTINIY
jgi:hypothetical protein